MVVTVVALATPQDAIPADSGGFACALASSVALGQATIVSWSPSPGQGCSPTAVRLLHREANTRGMTDTNQGGAKESATLAPRNSGTYYLEASINGWLADFRNAPVTVGLPVVNGRPTVEITQPDQNALFAQAVGVPNAVVRIAGHLDLDLSDMSDIFVAPGVEIIGERALFPNGPRLFTKQIPVG
jgi:hypothetical protein